MNVKIFLNRTVILKIYTIITKEVQRFAADNK